jgi:U5 small nuclear ribonucleoprotein component
VTEVTAGNMVLISGIDQAITKTATITHADNLPNGVDIILPLKFWSQPTIKVAIEPLIPNELPKLIEAIRRVNKSYLLLRTKVE